MKSTLTKSAKMMIKTLRMGFALVALLAGLFAGQADAQQTITYPTTTTLTSALNPSAAGQVVTLTATVAPTPFGGMVTFQSGDTPLGVGRVINGKAVFSMASLPAGTSVLTAHFSGISLSMLGDPSRHIPSRRITYQPSASAPLTQTVQAPGSADAAFATGSSSGYASGQTITYPTTTSLTATPNPSTVGQTVTLTAYVSSRLGTPLGGKWLPVPGGTVTFKDGSATIGSGRISMSKATFSTTGLAPGTHALTAHYSGYSGGTTSFLPSTSNTQTQHVINPAGATTLTSSLNPSIVGQSVTFTAAVTPAGGDPTPTGTVQFAVDGVTTGSAVTLDGSGRATDTEAALTVGTHSVTTTFTPTSAYTGSTTATLTQTVQPFVNGSTALTSSLNPSLVGQSVTFTAAVTAPSGSPTPTGTVQFAFDGSSVGDPITLDGSGQATNTEAALATGSHSVTVTFTPTNAYTGSTTATLTQTVIPHVSPQYVSPTGNDSGDGSQGNPKLTLQAAINATQSSDTVIAEDGTYTGPGDVDLDFGGRNITVTSQNGPVTTILNCGGTSSANHRAFLFDTGETAAVLNGLTIENGYESSNTDNFGNCGGGVNILSGCTVAVTNCVFTNNYSGARGGGIYVRAGTLTLTNCVFTSNSAVDYGGAVHNSIGTVTLTDCTLTGNSVSGGIDQGGALGNSGTLTLTDCILASNSAGLGSAAANVYGGTTTMTCCTLTGNNATGAVYNTDTLTLTNDILYGDSGGEINSTGSVNVAYCDIQGGYTGTGNINADPLFVLAPTDLHLRPGSPCVGAGTSIGAPTIDLDGKTHSNPPTIGAYEGTKLAATTLTTANLAGAAGQTVTLSATLTSNGVGVSGRTITFTVNGVVFGTAITNSSGIATKAYTLSSGLSVGSHPIIASFAGDNVYAPSSGSGTLTVSKAATAIAVPAVSGAAGTTMTLTATLTRTTNNAGISGATLRFQVNGTAAAAAVTNASGVVSLTYAIPPGTASGAIPVTVSYGGSGVYIPSTGIGTLTVP